MKSRQRRKLIKKRGPVIWEKAKLTYYAGSDLSAFYGWNDYEARSAYFPGDTKKD